MYEVHTPIIHHRLDRWATIMADFEFRGGVICFGGALLLQV
jgi:hypothetical protein